MRSLQISILAAILCTVVRPGVSQSFAPFTAKTRTVYYNIAFDGTKTVTRVLVGTYSRSSEGKTLAMRHTIDNGTPGPDWAFLTDASGAVTRIDWGRKEGVLVQEGVGPGYARPFAQAEGERRTINGVSCVMVPMVARVCQNGSCQPEPPDPRNFDCASPEYGVVVHKDLIQHIGIRTIETVEDTYNFIRQEPDAAAMQVPAGFARRRSIVTRPPGRP